MRHSDARRLGTLPNASGTLTRLAYAHAKEGGIDLRPLLRQANLTPDQIKKRICGSASMIKSHF